LASRENKKPEKIARRKFRPMARVAAPPGNPAAGDEGMPVTTFPLKRAVLFKTANCDAVAARQCAS
jgi:hypothetical protein